MTKQKPKICHYSDIPAEIFGDEAPGVTIRWLITENDGAPFYALRMIEVSAGGHTPHHQHPFEHENFIIEGQGKVQIDDKWRELSSGDIVFVPPNVPHTYVNDGDKSFKFLCGIPISRLIEK